MLSPWLRTMHIWSYVSKGKLPPAPSLHFLKYLIAFFLSKFLSAMLKITAKFAGAIALKHSSMIAAFVMSLVSGRGLASITRITSENELLSAIPVLYFSSHYASGICASFRPGVSMRPTFFPSSSHRNVVKVYVHPSSESADLNFIWLLSCSRDISAFKQELLPTPNVPKTDTTRSAFQCFPYGSNAC